MALAVRNNALREMPPFLSSKKSVDILREKLILSGIEEIQLHGLRDFSLRKAAPCCELSSPHAISTSEIKMTSSPQPHIYLCAMERHPAKDAGEPHTTTRECIRGICVAYIQFPVETPHSRSFIHRRKTHLRAIPENLESVRRLVNHEIDLPKPRSQKSAPPF